MTPFFDVFPKVDYKVGTDTGLYKHSDNVTNIFFRLGMVKDILSNISSYYVYEILEGESPEVLADRVYGDINAGWIIIYANQIFDPQFDWPLTNGQFDKYIIKKYGSLQAAKASVHHYEKVIERTETKSGVTTTTILPLSYTRLTQNEPEAPFDFYKSYLVKKGTTSDSTLIHSDSSYYTADDEDVIDYGLETVKAVDTYNISGKTIKEVTYSRRITNYDYEEQANEKKRTIRIIKAQYYNMIIDEFVALTGNKYTRRLPY